LALVDIAAHLWYKIAKKPNFEGVIKRFLAKRSRYFNVHIQQITFCAFKNSIWKISKSYIQKSFAPYFSRIFVC